MLETTASKDSGNESGLTLSYSRIHTYQACPRKYKLQYEDGIRTPPTPYTSLGLSVHKALEEFHRSGGGSLEKLMESYDQVWVNEGFQSPAETLQFYGRGRDMLERYWAEAQNTNASVAFVEKDFRFSLGDFRLGGIVDRIDLLPDGTHELIEYKTHYEVWPASRIENDLQVTLYAAACREALGLSLSKITFYFLAKGVKKATVRTEEQQAQALDLARDVGAKIESREFSPNLSHCERCDVWKFCSFGREHHAALRH